MSLYRYDTDANHFAGIGFSMEDDDRVTNVHFSDKAIADDWVPPVAHGFDEDPEVEGDFPTLYNYGKIPVMTERAWNALRSLIGCCCEVLPMIHPSGKPYFIVHVLETIDCLDEEKSEVSRSQIDGRISRISKYALRTDLLADKVMFKLPLKSGADLIVNDDFRKTVEANRLLGLKFRALAQV